MLVSGDGAGGATRQTLVPVQPRQPDVDVSKPRPDSTIAEAPRHNDLVTTACKGSPVEAGRALAALDDRNGTRSATDAQVSAFRESPSIVTTDHKVETASTGGNRTTSATTTSTRTSGDEIEQAKHARSWQSTVGADGASVNSSSSSTQTTREYDDKGNLKRDPNTGKPIEVTVSRSERSETAKVDGSGGSYSASASGQRGSVGGSASTTTTLGQNGLGNQSSVQGKIGKVAGDAGGGFEIGKDGVTINGEVGVGAGPLSAQHEREHVQTATSTKDTATTTVKLETSGGKPVSGKIEYQQTEVRELSRNDKDGSTTYQVTGDTKLTLGAGVDVKQVRVDTSWLSGQRTVHTITVPAGADVTKIDPSKPEAWPQGTQVMISAEDYKGSTLGVSYARFGIEAGSEVRSGTSIVLERQAGDRVSVASGPTEGFTTSGKLKVDVAGFGASLGGENQTDFTFARTFNIDLKASGGAEAFAGVLTGQPVPTANGNGVSDLMTVTTGDWNYTGGAKLETPLGDVGPEHKEGSHSVWRTFADGHVDVARTYDANGDGTDELTRISSSTDGITFGPATYVLHTQIGNETERFNGAQQLNTPTLKVGDKVDVSLTASDLQTLRGKDQSFAPQGAETPEVQGREQDGFAEYIARSGGADALLSKLVQLKSSPNVGDYTSSLPGIDLRHPLPGSVSVTSKS